MVNRLYFGEYDVPDYPESCDLATWNAYTAAWNHYWDIRALCTPDDFPAHRQLTRHAYPGQPSTKAEHVVQPCCCEYHRHHLLTTAHIEGIDIVLNPVIATTFQIHPACPHHGHRANTHLIERLWSDPYSNGILRDPYDMDDDERRSP
jgi:hypothetical protein